MVVTLGQQYDVREKHYVTLYTYYINRHAGIPNKIRTKDTMSLDYNSICNISWSRIRWVSMKEIYWSWV